MKKLSNLILIILFSLCGSLVILFLTFFNPHFILHEITKYNYYEKINVKLVEELETLEIDYIIDSKILNNDIEKYVKSRYKKYYIGNKIKSSCDTEKVYLKYVKFDGFFEKNKIHEITYILFVTLLVLIIITGSLFNKTKKYHNLNIILLMSSIIMILLYGVFSIFIKIDNDFIYQAIVDSNHYLLGISVVILEISLFKIIKDHFIKK